MSEIKFTSEFFFQYGYIVKDLTCKSAQTMEIDLSDEEHPGSQNVSPDQPENPNLPKLPSISNSNQRPVTSSAPLGTSSSSTPTKSNTSPAMPPRTFPNISQHQRPVVSLAPPGTLTSHGPGPVISMKPGSSMTQTPKEGQLVKITLPDGEPGLRITVSHQMLDNLVPGQVIPTCRNDHFLKKTAQGQYQIIKTIKTSEHQSTLTQGQRTEVLPTWVLSNSLSESSKIFHNF